MEKLQIQRSQFSVSDQSDQFQSFMQTAEHVEQQPSFQKSPIIQKNFFVKNKANSPDQSKLYESILNSQQDFAENNSASNSFQSFSQIQDNLDDISLDKLNKVSNQYEHKANISDILNNQVKGQQSSILQQLGDVIKTIKAAEDQDEKELQMTKDKIDILFKRQKQLQRKLQSMINLAKFRKNNTKTLREELLSLQNQIIQKSNKNKAIEHKIILKQYQPQHFILDADQNLNNIKKYQIKANNDKKSLKINQMYRQCAKSYAQNCHTRQSSNWIKIHKDINLQYQLFIKYISDQIIQIKLVQLQQQNQFHYCLNIKDLFSSRILQQSQFNEEKPLESIILDYKILQYEPKKFFINCKIINETFLKQKKIEDDVEQCICDVIGIPMPIIMYLQDRFSNLIIYTNQQTILKLHQNIKSKMILHQIKIINIIQPDHVIKLKQFFEKICWKHSKVKQRNTNQLDQNATWQRFYNLRGSTELVYIFIGKQAINNVTNLFEVNFTVGGKVDNPLVADLIQYICFFLSN